MVNIFPLLITIGFSKDLSNWIGDNLDILGPKTLRQITLPGTHDSGTYNLTTQVMPGSQSWLLQVCTQVGQALLKQVDQLVQDWTRTQKQDFYSQMKGGIRYFDIRAGWFNRTQQWVIFHQVIGNPVSQLLSNISQFLQDHPKQIVIVQISHLKGHPSHHQVDILKDIVVKTLGEFLHPVDLNFRFTVDEMVKTGKRALVSISKKDYSSFDIWPKKTIHNTYPHTDIVDHMVKYNKKKVEKYHSSTWSNQLYKVSWILTPTAQTITACVFPWEVTTMIQLADTCNPYLPQFWMEVKRKGYRTGNILIIDHYENSSIMDVVLDMNGLLTQVASS